MVLAFIARMGHVENWCCLAARWLIAGINVVPKWDISKYGKYYLNLYRTAETLYAVEELEKSPAGEKVGLFHLTRSSFGTIDLSTGIIEWEQL